MSGSKHYKRNFKPCGARRRSDGAPCQRRPDPSSISGKCYLHGGASLKGFESPQFKRGHMSKYVDKDKIVKKIENYRKSDDVRNLRDELAILRGILHSYIDHRDNLLDDERIETLIKLIDKIEKLVSSLKVIEEGHTFTIKNVNNIILQLVKIIQMRVTDENTRSSIAKDIRKLAYIL